MAIWERLFQRNDVEDIPPPGYFGRFSDAYKSAERYGNWDAAMLQFELRRYLEALNHFLNFLKNGREDNIIVHDKARIFSFQIIQGSRKIVGKVENERLVVTSVLVQGKEYSTILLRRLLEVNYALNYCRFALDEKDQITLVFDSYLRDANPYKLYYGLKELALQADKMDDLILNEFIELKPNDNDHARPLTDELVKLKSDYYFAQLNVLNNKLSSGHLQKENDPNIIIYAILSTFYKLDYLLTPHGFASELIEQAHRNYFADGTHTVEQKVIHLEKSLDDLLEIPSSKLEAEWYDVIYTFGLNSSIDLYQAKSIIQSEMKQIDWHIENNQFDTARNVTEFIIGYLLFDYATDHLLKTFLTLYYRIIDEQYCAQQGNVTHFYSKNGELNEKRIDAECKAILSKYSHEFHKAKVPIDELNYESIYHFGQSLLHMILSSRFSPLDEKR